MSRRMRAVAVIKNDDQDRPFWHQIGMAFESKTKPGQYLVRLNSLPIGGKFYLFPEVEQDKPVGSNLSMNAGPTDPTDAPPHTDEEIPF